MCRQVLTTITTLVIVGLIVQVTYGQESREGEELVLTIKDDQKTQYINQNFETNVYNYGYEINPDGQFHHEVHGSDGLTYGCYGYVDPFGMLTATFYISDGWGYRVVHPRQSVEIFLHKHEHHRPNSTSHDHDHEHHEHHGILTSWENLQFPKECGNFENISTHSMRPHPSKPGPIAPATSTGSSGQTPIQYPIPSAQSGTTTSSGHVPNYPSQSQPGDTPQIHPRPPTQGQGPASIPESSSVQTSRPIPIEDGKPTRPDGTSPQSAYPSYNGIPAPSEYPSQVGTPAQSAHPSPTQPEYPPQTEANVPTQSEHPSQSGSATQQGHPIHVGTPAQSGYPSQTGVQIPASPDIAPAQPTYPNQPGSGVTPTVETNSEPIIPQPAYPSPFEPMASPKPQTSTELPATLEYPSKPEKPLYTHPKPEHSKPSKPHKPPHSHAKPDGPHHAKPEKPPQQPSQPIYPSPLKPTVSEAPTIPYPEYPSSSSANKPSTTPLQPEYPNLPFQPVNPNQEKPSEPGKPFHPPSKPGHSKPPKPEKPSRPHAHHGHYKPSRPEKPSHLKPHKPTTIDQPGSQTSSRPEPPSHPSLQPGYPSMSQSGMPLYPSNQHGYPMLIRPMAPLSPPQLPGYPTQSQPTGETSDSIESSNFPGQSQPANPSSHPQTSHSYPDQSQLSVLPFRPQTSNGYLGQSQSGAPPSYLQTSNGYPGQPQPAAPPSRPQSSNGYQSQPQSGVLPSGPQTLNGYPNRPESAAPPSHPQTSNGYPTQPETPLSRPQSSNGYPSQPQPGVLPSRPQTSNGYPGQPQSGVLPSRPQTSNEYPTQPESHAPPFRPQTLNGYPGRPQSGVLPSRPPTSNGYPTQFQPTAPTTHPQTSFSYPSKSKPADPLRPPVSSGYPSISHSNGGYSYPQSQSGYPASLKPESPSPVDLQTGYLPASKLETSLQPEKSYVKPLLTNYPSPSRPSSENSSSGFSNATSASASPNGNTGPIESSDENGPVDGTGSNGALGGVGLTGSVGGTDSTGGLGENVDNRPIGPDGSWPTGGPGPAGPWPGDSAHNNENQPETYRPYSSGPDVPIGSGSSIPTEPKYYQNAVVYSDTIKNPGGTRYVYGKNRDSVQEHLHPAPFALTENSPRRDDTSDNYRRYNEKNQDDSFDELHRAMVSQVVSSDNNQQGDKAKFIVGPISSQKNIEGEDMVKVDETIYQNREGPNSENHELLYQISKYNENYENIIPQDQRQLDTNLTPPRKHVQEGQGQNHRTQFEKSSTNHGEMKHTNEKPISKFAASGVQPPDLIKIKSLPLPVGPNPKICPCYVVESNNSTNRPPAPTTTTTTTTTTPKAIVGSMMSERPIQGILGFIPVIFVPHCPGDQTDSEDTMKSIFPSATSIPYPCSVCNSQHTDSAISGQYVNLISQLGNIKAIKRLLSEANFGYLNVPVISTNNGRSRRQKVK